MDKLSNRCKGFDVPSLEDGIYDAIVVDAVEEDNGTMTIDIALSSGPHRGEVVTINATNLGRSWTDLLAAPATLSVVGGSPTLTFDS